MARSIKARIGILAICAVALFGSIAGPLKAAREYTPPFAFNGVTWSPRATQCDDFTRRAHAQRFFETPRDSRLRQLDPDRDGRACEDFDY